MRRIYQQDSKNNKSTSIKDAALKQLRETREKLTRYNPDMLKNLRKQIKQAQTKAIVQEKIQALHSEPDTVINKQKNIETIIKMLDEKDDNPAFNIAVKAMLAKHQH